MKTLLVMTNMPDQASAEILAAALIEQRNTRSANGRTGRFGRESFTDLGGSFRRQRDGHIRHGARVRGRTPRSESRVRLP